MITTLLLAGTPPERYEDAFRSLRTAFRAGPTGSQLRFVFIGLLVLALVVLVAARLIDRRSRRRAPQTVDYLKLAVDVLGLSESQRRDLQTLARRGQLDEPAAMLLSPANLEHAMRRIERGAADAELRSRINELCLELFDVPLPRPANTA
jgi:hypothetical protein